MISKEENKRLSKLLSYVLRHNPEHLQIQLNNNGWTKVENLINKLNREKNSITLDILKHIVNTNDKKRFSFNNDFTWIRASQGHSIELDLDYAPQIHPEIFFHGTAEVNVNVIFEKGLLKMSRQHVHLSADKETAFKDGQRHGTPIVLSIQSLKIYEQEHLFFISDNGVWLTDHVPAGSIEI